MVFNIAHSIFAYLRPKDKYFATRPFYDVKQNQIVRDISLPPTISPMPNVRTKNGARQYCYTYAYPCRYAGVYSLRQAPIT